MNTVTTIIHSDKVVTKVIDGNEAAAWIAYRCTEVIAIYPITPSSTMGELSDEWAAKGTKNLWGNVPTVFEMQSEAGAAGVVHGAVLGGALSTTFTSSQGLLLMIPTLYKIAGELTPFVIHVAARTLATHALSIFGDHSDVMSCRGTGFAMLSGGSVQEAHDFAAISHAATLRCRVPFMNFFDGFRTSHELAKIEMVSEKQLAELVDHRGQLVADHRARGLTPDRPTIRGTAQNPDVFFQARESANAFYEATPVVVQSAMDDFAKVTGRQYHLFDYEGDPRAERVIIIMGSGGETVEETVHALNKKGEKVGVLRVRLYRPFDVARFLAALPVSAKRIAVLDRTKEPGAVGEPLFLDVVAALASTGKKLPLVIGGRYGLSSKEFTPAMVVAVFDELNKPHPKPRFTVGIVDDVSGLSLNYDPNFTLESEGLFSALFYGLGSDGTVGANKNTIKILGEDGDRHAQAYFVYDSKKSGAVTVSHLRFGPKPIRAPYLVTTADFVACHQFSFLDKYDLLDAAKPGAVFLLNSPFGKDEVWKHVPHELREQIVNKKLKLFVIDAYKVSRAAGMGNRINAVMQTCFFAISGVMPKDEAITAIKESIKKVYGRKGEEVVKRNWTAVDQTLAELEEVTVPTEIGNGYYKPPVVSEKAPDFVKKVTAVMLANKGDLLPVSAFPVDGTWPTATSHWEKRNLAAEIPVWNSQICIQCNKCAFVCPHAAIRAKAYTPGALEGAPATFKSVDAKGQELKNFKYTLQVAPEDCTGCGLCVAACPVKDKAEPKNRAINMKPQGELRLPERDNFDFFLKLPELDRSLVKADVKGTQFLQPLFEFSGACSGCGETPYIKLLTQLFGDRMLVANATGCSSIYGGNLPTTPYCKNEDGRGPAWANSLFEDNAEFGLGLRLSVDQHTKHALALLDSLAPQLNSELVIALKSAEQSTESQIAAQRSRVSELRGVLKVINHPDAALLSSLADYLVKKSVWILGGDGWAYDIGYGGLDHVLATGQKVNILVLDTEVYSNTGGQQSKATPLAAAAKFAVNGKGIPKKDLGLMAISYGNVYVARVAFGAKDAQTVKAFQEAEAHPGPSIIIAYAPCIAHGFDLQQQLTHQQAAVDSGYWPLFRYDPKRTEGPMQIDSAPPKGGLNDFLASETRFRMVQQANPERFKELSHELKEDLARRLTTYKDLAAATTPEATAKVAAAAISAATPAGRLAETPNGSSHVETKKN